MSAPVLDTRLSPDSKTFRANAAHNRALAGWLLGRELIGAA